MVPGLLGESRHRVYELHGSREVLELVSAGDFSFPLLPLRHGGKAFLDLFWTQSGHGSFLAAWPWEVTAKDCRSRAAVWMPVRGDEMIPTGPTEYATRVAG